MRNNKILFPLALILFSVLVVPVYAEINPETIAITSTVNYSLVNGSYISGIGSMGASDGVNGTFKETLHVIADDATTYDLDTDNATEWQNMGAISAVAADAVTTLSTSAIVATFNASTGDAKLHYDNGTSNSMNIPLLNIDSYNFSMRTDHSLVAIESIDLHYDSDTYFNTTFNTFLSTEWSNFTLHESDFVSVGGMTHHLEINYINFHFAPRNMKKVWIDLVHLVGEASGSEHRELEGTISFSDIASRQNYVLNLSSTRDAALHSYQDTFATESTFGWVSNDTNHLNIYNTTINYAGEGAIIFTWDGTTNCTATFDNGTTNNMQLDFSEANVESFHMWANNTNTVIAETRYFTNASNYFFTRISTHLTMDNTIHTNYALSLFQSHGSPSWANISYIEYDFNTYYSSVPTNVTLDEFEIGEGDDIVFYIIEDGEFTVYSIHSHGFYQNNTFVLSSSLSQEIRDTGKLTVYFHDTHATDHDTTNNTLYIDLLIVTGWNDYASGGQPPSPFTPTPTTPILIYDPVIVILAVSSIFVICFAFYIARKPSKTVRNRTYGAN